MRDTHPVHPKNTPKFGYALLMTTALGAAVILFILPPIPQDPGYHLFKDTRQIFGIPNFWNVVTNIPFLVIGIQGLCAAHFANRLITVKGLGHIYTLFFTSILLIGPGSIHYHLFPDNTGLLWDRLPMSVAFMSLFAIILGEFISVRLARGMALPLILTGVFSVVSWFFTETSGRGDLRLYAFVQFYPLLAVPVILCFFRSRCTRAGIYWKLFVTYAVAKVFECLDAEVYALSGFISGHSLKHLLSALGLYLLLASYTQRTCT